MPEPPKITTSLADRIARLNANQKINDKNQITEKKNEIGEIKSKISKYEANGQYEAPLIPKGSFGLGAPITKTERGLDRIRIASLGVSGGMNLSNSTTNTNFTRSVSLGKSQTSKLSNNLIENNNSNSNITPPSSSLSNNQINSLSPLPNDNTGLDSPTCSIIHRPITPEQQELQQQKQQDESTDLIKPLSVDSNQVYDGILDGYPTTPAEEDNPPMVTCSNCLKNVELELLSEHICQILLNNQQGRNNLSMEEFREDFPIDVPESPIDNNTYNNKEEIFLKEKLIINESSYNNNNKKKEKLITSSSSPCIKEKTSPKIMIKEEEINKTSSDSSSNTTNRITNSINRVDFRACSPIYRNWHDDDDDDNDCNDSNGATGFVTIVKSSSRV